MWGLQQELKLTSFCSTKMNSPLLKEELSEIQENILLKNYTTFKIGGHARYFLVVKEKEQLLKAVKLAKKLKIPFFILGGGSNLLVSDGGFNGLVIKMGILGAEFKGNKLFAGAGESLSKLTFLSAGKGLSGLEWAGGIPSATAGGAIYGHAQAFGEKISKAVESVEALDSNTLKFKNFSKKQCRFSVKNSIFKKNKNIIIVSCILRLKPDDKNDIKNKVEEFLNYRKERHPDFPSAGSVFVNPEKNGETIRVGALIEKCGLKGKKIGNAQISEQHANFIINLGGAKAEDVLRLINLAKQKVKKTFGVELEQEIQIVGF